MTTRNLFIIQFTVSLAMFMEAVDATVLNTAIPSMAHSLNVNPIDLKIALISYLLSLAIFIPISGWVADKYGIKRVFVGALLIFTLSSLWCGFSHSLVELILARTLQGLGGSLTLPVGRLIIIRSFARHQLINVMSRVIMVAAVGMMLGPVLGGYITHYLSWRWVFWINIPVGILTTALALYSLKEMSPRPVPRLDILGFILFGTSLAAFTFGLSAFSETYVADSIAFCVMIIAVLLMCLYITHSRRLTHPIVKTQLFRHRTFFVSSLGNLFARLGFGGTPFLLPLLLQLGLNYPPQISGLLIAPTALGVVIVKPFIMRLLRLFGYQRLLIINTILVALSLWVFTTINSTSSVYVISLDTFLFGFLISLQYSAMNSLAYAEIDEENFSAATSVVSTLQQLSQSFGVAVSAFLLRIYSPSQVKQFVLTPTVFHHVFFAMGILTLLSVFIFVQLKREDGHELITPR